MNTELKNYAIDFGTKLGGLLAVSNIIFYAIDYKLFLNPMIGIGFFIVIVITGILSSVKGRNIVDNLDYNWSNAFKTYFLTVSVGYLIGSLATVVIFVVVDPGAAKILDQEMLIMTMEFMENFGATQEDIAQITEEASTKSNFSISSISLQYVMNLAIFSVIGLLTSLITKKSN